jgi:hypothetical protein
MHTRVAAAYGLSSLFLALVHNVFLLFHVQIFLTVFQISRSSFLFAELVFLAWNSINDFVYGFLSDISLLNEANCVRVTRQTLVGRCRCVCVCVCVI